MAEIISWQDAVRAVRRRRTRELTRRCLVLIDEAISGARGAYGMAPEWERPLRATKIRQLEELRHYCGSFE